VHRSIEMVKQRAGNNLSRFDDERDISLARTTTFRPLLVRDVRFYPITFSPLLYLHTTHHAYFLIHKNSRGRHRLRRRRHRFHARHRRLVWHQDVPHGEREQQRGKVATKSEEIFLTDAIPERERKSSPPEEVIKKDYKHARERERERESEKVFSDFRHVTTDGINSTLRQVAGAKWSDKKRNFRERLSHKNTRARIYLQRATTFSREKEME